MGGGVSVRGGVTLWLGDAVLLVALCRDGVRVSGRGGESIRFARPPALPVSLLRLLRGWLGLRAGERMDGGGLFDWMYDVAQRLCFVPNAPRGGGGVGAAHRTDGKIRKAPHEAGRKITDFLQLLLSG